MVIYLTQISFYLGKYRVSYILTILIFIKCIQSEGTVGTLQFSAVKNRRVRKAGGIMDINNLSQGTCRDWRVIWWYLSKAGENDPNLQHMWLFDILWRAHASHLAPFGSFAQTMGLNPWSKKSTSKVKLYFNISLHFHDQKFWFQKCNFWTCSKILFSVYLGTWDLCR